MDKFWKSNLGKLVLGSCGAQVGLAVGFIGLSGLALVIFLCGLTTILSVAGAGEIARLSAEAVSTPAPDAQVEALRGEINSLVTQVDVLRSGVPAGPPPAPAPQPVLPQPIAIAHTGQANLRTGPDIVYSRVGAMAAGESLEVVGRNQDSSWWLVARPEGVAWVSNEVVLIYGPTENVPVVTIPALLVLPGLDGEGASNPPGDAAPALAPASTVSPTPNRSLPVLPAGTPTAIAAQSRIFVQDTVGWKRLREQLGKLPASESFSPHGERIAVIDGVSVYLVAGDGSYGQVLYSDDGVRRPVGDAVWSPDGNFLAFRVDYLYPKCRPCRGVGLVDLSEETLIFLETPDQLDCDGPRWTQDGRLLVNVHPGEPAKGTTYAYDRWGQGEPASGVYLLSSSHDGQKWLPWRPGRVWQAGVSERPDTYCGN
jgi:hypothetical protein